MCISPHSIYCNDEFSKSWHDAMDTCIESRETPRFQFPSITEEVSNSLSQNHNSKIYQNISNNCMQALKSRKYYCSSHQISCFRGLGMTDNPGCCGQNPMSSSCWGHPSHNFCKWLDSHSKTKDMGGSSNSNSPPDIKEISSELLCPNHFFQIFHLSFFP